MTAETAEAALKHSIADLSAFTRRQSAQRAQGG
jgi:hypothetical protein